MSQERRVIEHPLRIPLLADQDVEAAQRQRQMTADVGEHGLRRREDFDTLVIFGLSGVDVPGHRQRRQHRAQGARAALSPSFADVEQGKAFTSKLTSQSSNPYSGKWNWHFEDDADTLDGNCEAQFVRYVKLLMSLETLPEDLTTLTPDQTEKCVSRLSKFPLAELRRRQALANRQIELAFMPCNEAALANLHVRVEHLRMAVDRQTFGDRSVGRRRSGEMSSRP